MNNILIFGGTTEGRILAEQLSKKGFRVILSVATNYGKEVLPNNQKREAASNEKTPPHTKASNFQILVGRKDVSEIIHLMEVVDFTYCIDATHPYATEVTKNIRESCAATDTPYLRLIRPDSPPMEDAIYVPNLEEACQYISKTKQSEKNVLFTTGAKELAPISKYFSDEMDSIYIRTLPIPDGIQKCQRAGFSDDHILTGNGPFSKEENITTLKKYHIDFLVTKDSGTSGGFLEKIEAAKECGIIPLILRRPAEDGYTLDEILANILSSI